MGDAGHVDAARGDVGRHQNLHLAVPQRHQAAVAQPLAERAVQRDGREARLLQVAGQAVAFDLRAGEDDGLADRRVAQPMVEQLPLVVGVVGPVQRLLDVGVLFLRRVDLHPLHVGAALVHHAQRQLLDARRKRGREHHGLLALRGELVDFGQVVGKAQVEHAVGLVDDEELHLVQLDLHRALQVQQAPGGRDDEVGVLQLGDLHLVGHAADDGGDAQALAMLDQADGVVRHLLRELARRAQHQSTGHRGLEMARVERVLALGALGQRLAARAGLGGRRLVLGALARGLRLLLLQERVQHRQEEGRGLAAAGLARDHQVDEAGVLGAHGHGDDLFLHLGRLGVTQVGDRLQKFGRQAQGGEAVGGDGHGRRRRRKIALRVHGVCHVMLNKRAGAARVGFVNGSWKHPPSDVARAGDAGLVGPCGQALPRGMRVACGPGEKGDAQSLREIVDSTQAGDYHTIRVSPQAPPRTTPPAGAGGSAQARQWIRARRRAQCGSAPS